MEKKKKAGIIGAAVLFLCIAGSFYFFVYPLEQQYSEVLYDGETVGNSSIFTIPEEEIAAASQPGACDSGKEKGPEEEQEDEIQVYVCGEVNCPGVYSLRTSGRVIDAVEAAGGLTKEAAGDFLNLAALLIDGEKVYVPSQKEIKDLPRTIETEAKGTPEEGGKININTATKEQLLTLPGIGESKAESIIRYRDEQGLFSSVEDIMKITGIKDGVFQKLKDRIRV